MNNDVFTEEMYAEDEFDGGNLSPLETQQNNDGGGANPGNEPNDHEPSNIEDLTTEVLRLKGITDPSKIKFQDDNGAVIERSWDSLSRAEQINILTDQQDDDSQLDEDELELINTIRNSGMTVSDYIESLKPVQEQPAQPSYKINELTDEEVFALDLLDKVGSDNITDEEIDEAILNAKKNEKLFKKTIEGLRAEYIRLQQDEEAKAANERAEQQQAAYNQFATSINREIQGFDSFVGQPLELSQEDQEDLAAFMLELDDNGTSAFGRALNNPKFFTKAAFWLLNEDKITEELTKQMRDNYTRGYEQAKRDLQGNKSKLVFNPKPKKNQDPFIDDEDW